MGYYDAQKGYYVGDSGQTDYDRTIAAIQYYEKNNMKDKKEAAVQYALKQPWNAPNYIPDTTTGKRDNQSGQTGVFGNTNNNNNNNNTNNNNTANASGQYYVPYESKLNDLIDSYPQYTAKTDAEIAAEAKNYADIQVNPQKTSLQTALSNAINSLNNQENDVTADYATVGQTADRLLANAQTSGTASAIARGGGRSGAVEYEVGQLKQPIMENVTQAEAEKAAKLADIANSRTTVQTTHDNAVVDLEAQRGALVAQRLAAIKELDYAKQTGRADAILAATQKLSAVTQAANEFNNTQLYNYSALMGKTPDTSDNSALDTLNNTNVSADTTSTSGGVGLREYATSHGATVGYDATTQTVIVNGKKYTPYQLQQLGAYMNNNSWYIPESAMQALI